MNSTRYIFFVPVGDASHGVLVKKDDHIISL
jgi:hypothetical protein